MSTERTESRSFKLTPELMKSILEQGREEVAPAPGTNDYFWLKQIMFGAGQTECAICETPLDLNLKHPHPASVQLDHIIPIKRPGGTNLVRNLQLAHLFCNGSKNDDRVPGYPNPHQARWRLARRVRAAEEPGWIEPPMTPEENAEYWYTYQQTLSGFWKWNPEMRPFLLERGYIPGDEELS